VVAIHYCYQSTLADLQNSTRKNVFEFISLKQESDVEFTVQRRFLIRNIPRFGNITSCAAPTTPGDVELVCCVTRNLNTLEFSIPSENYTFGLYLRQRPLLAFTNSTRQYNVRQIQAGSPPDYIPPSVGDHITLDEERLIVAPLLLLRLLIGERASARSFSYMQLFALTLQNGRQKFCEGGLLTEQSL
jgi:hypothetical protein